MAAFVAVEEYETWTQTELDASQYAAVELQLEAACDDVRRFLHQDLDYTEHDMYVVDGPGTRGLILPQLPVIAVHEISIYGEVVTDWRDAGDGLIYRTLGIDNWWCWPHGPVWPAYSAIVVDYTHGYPALSDGFITVPANIKRAAMALARVGYETAGRSTGISSETIGPFTTSYLTPKDQAEHDVILNTLARATVHPVPVI